MFIVSTSCISMNSVVSDRLVLLDAHLSLFAGVKNPDAVHEKTF